MRPFSGFWPALITPYTADDQINLTVLRELVDYHLSKQVTGFYLCGSTGEGAFQTVAERKLVTETVMARVDGRVPIIVHVGAAVLNDATHLARHAQESGAAGISSILPPVIYNQQGVVPFFERVAAAAPELPFLPYLLGVSRDVMTLMHEMAHIPTLAGTKYTGPNMYEMNQVVRFRSEGWTVFSGMDEQAALGLMYGAAGIIGSTFNLMPGVYREIYASVRRGDHAQALDLQRRANRITELMIRHGFVGAFREGMRLLGFDCGQPRLPNLPLPEEKRASLHASFQELGLADLAAL
ncbi:MAG: dihydrodipicolinate synthase family protein [Anaerolineae bacterium]|jgi:N-acetylneuraminate lyase